MSFPPFGLILFPILFILALYWPRRAVKFIGVEKASVARRFFALGIDLYIVLIGVLPIISLPILFLEYLATGVWQWSFERAEFRASVDIPLIVSIFLVFFGFYYYFKWHLDRDRQTFGQMVLGIKLYDRKAWKFRRVKKM